MTYLKHVVLVIAALWTWLMVIALVLAIVQEVVK